MNPWLAEAPVRRGIDGAAILARAYSRGGPPPPVDVMAVVDGELRLVCRACDAAAGRRVALFARPGLVLWVEP